MRIIGQRVALAAIVCIFITGAMASRVRAQPDESLTTPATIASVLARMDEIKDAARSLDPEKVFSFVLENDAGSLVQNGELFPTRQLALESTRQGFRGLKEVDYQFDHQHVTLLSPTVALVTGDGSTTATTDDGRVFSTRFAQTVVLLMTEGEWKVFHAHRSFPPAD